MKVLYVRNDDIDKSHYTTSQIETIKALREKNVDARLMIKGRKKSKIPYINSYKKFFEKK